MCTITWIAEEESYEIFFNRDELKTRRPAEEPQIFKNRGISAIHPVDPDGSGSWIFANDRGLSAALLNFKSSPEEKDYLSRGSIITDICFMQSAEEMAETVRNLDLEKYRGFTLCLFELQKKPAILRWNGTKLLNIDPLQPLTSSSVKLEKVIRNRETLFKNLIKEKGDTGETHLLFHKSHYPEKSYLSTCMHREDAETVSFSRIKSGHGSVEFTYAGESLCRESPLITLTMTLNKYEEDRKGFNASLHKRIFPETYHQ